VRDRVFTGAGVAEALAAASAALGIAAERLRHVVLEEGAPGGRGLSATPARIAVLLEDPRAPMPDATPTSAPGPEGARAGMRTTLRALREAAGIDVEAEIEEGEQAVVVRLAGPDEGFFAEPDGRGEVLRAFEHLLQRMHGAACLSRQLRLECAGVRQRRDAALAEEARRLAEAVRADGQPRTTEPLNAYERRVIHMAVSALDGVTTLSVGEGALRRVSLTPTVGATGPTAPPDEDEGGDDAAS